MKQRLKLAAVLFAALFSMVGSVLQYGVERLAFAALTPEDVHIDAPLSALGVRAFNDQVDLIASQLFPIIGVPQRSDKYYVIPKENWLRIPNTKRSPGARPRVVDYAVSSDSYYADNFALETETPLEVLANADRAVQVRNGKTRFLMGLLGRDLENRAATLVNTANVGASVSFTNTNSVFKVSNISGDIISAVDSAHARIQQNTGLIANIMVVDWNVFSLLRRNALILDMYKYSRGGVVKEEELRNVFRVDRILVSKAIKNTAPEAAAQFASASMSSIWGNKIFLGYVDPSAASAENSEVTTYGLGFRWTDPELGAPMAVQRWVDPHRSKKVEYISADYYQVEKVIARDLGYLMVDVT